MQIVPYSPAIAARIAGLFSANPPVPTRLWANLDGTIRGRILVDEPTNPTCALIQDLAEGPTYLGGALTPRYPARGLRYPARIPRGRGVPVGR